jgi:hypothetical protein
MRRLLVFSLIAASSVAAIEWQKCTEPSPAPLLNRTCYDARRRMHAAIRHNATGILYANWALIGECRLMIDLETRLDHCNVTQATEQSFSYWFGMVFFILMTLSMFAFLTWPRWNALWKDARSNR